MWARRCRIERSNGEVFLPSSKASSFTHTRYQGAKIAGCKQIIGVDKNQDRLDVAQSIFGTTHSLNTTDLSDLTSAMKEIAGGRGPTVVVETTGFPLVLEGAYHAVDTKGSFVQIGGPPDPNYRFSMDLVSHLFRGVKLFGCVEGDSFPEEFIPQMIKHYREGNLPVDKMVKYYPAEDFKAALRVSRPAMYLSESSADFFRQDMHAGKTIKPVLVW